jgi:hypothetical protein
MYSQKYIFQIALKCERKMKTNFFLKKKKKSGRARFSGTGGDDHQFFFMWPNIFSGIAVPILDGVQIS